MKLTCNLKFLLDDRDISIRQFSKDIDYRFETCRTFYNNDAAKIKQIPVEFVLKTCSYLEIPIEDLFKIVQED